MALNPDVKSDANSCVDSSIKSIYVAVAISLATCSYYSKFRSRVVWTTDLLVQTVRLLLSSNANLLTVPRCSLTFGSRCFHVAETAVRNSPHFLSVCFQFRHFLASLVSFSLLDDIDLFTYLLTYIGIRIVMSMMVVGMYNIKTWLRYIYSWNDSCKCAPTLSDSHIHSLIA